MKIHIAANCLGLALLLTGCASAPPLVLDRVGPSKEPALARSNEGNLVVYSAWSPLMNMTDPDTSLHSDYTILSSDGAVYRKVRNWQSKVLREPASISLPPGRYTVEANSAEHGKVQVPVLIVAHRPTTIHLDGEPEHDFRGVAKSDLVSLPNGYVVGWRSE